MRKAILRLLFSELLFSACAASVQTPPVQPAPPTPPSADSIVVDPRIKALSQAARIVWMTQAAVSAVAYVTSKDLSRGPDDFLPQLAGRSTLAMQWKKARQSDAQNLYLDQLVALEEAGYLGDYVLGYLSAPGWTIPKQHLAALKTATFNQWMKEHWQGEQALTLAHYVYADNPETMAVPGETFAALDLRKPCAEIWPQLDTAVSSWSATTRANGQGKRALSVGTRSELLSLIAEDPMNDDIVWVSPLVADVHARAAICALEIGDRARSSAILERLASLSPRHPLVK